MKFLGGLLHGKTVPVGCGPYIWWCAPDGGFRHHYYRYARTASGKEMMRYVGTRRDIPPVWEWVHGAVK